jgi:raffinose/stachyose/melibiose transport system permease protein
MTDKTLTLARQRIVPRYAHRLAALRPGPTATAWLFLAPALFVYAVVILYPMTYSAWLSLFRWDGINPLKVFVGLENYVTLWARNRVFWIALKNNVIWTVASLVVPTGIGLLLAVALNRPFAGSTFFRSVFYFPAILSMAIVGLIWSWMYHPTLGLINQVLEALGLSALTHAWLSEPKFALYAAFAAAAWHNAGLPMLLYLAGLQTIPKELLEAARIDGASPWQSFRHVTLPLLRETTLVVMAITAINSLKVYDIIYVMTYGGPANQTQVLGTWMYFLTYNYNNVGLGTAIAVILFCITLIFAIPYARHMRQ